MKSIQYLKNCKFLHQLSTLKMGVNKINSNGIKTLKECEFLSQLVHLDLNINLLDDESCQILSECKQLSLLSSLNLRLNSGIGENGLKCLLESKYLVQISEYKCSKKFISEEFALEWSKNNKFINIKE